MGVPHPVSIAECVYTDTYPWRQVKQGWGYSFCDNVIMTVLITGFPWNHPVSVYKVDWIKCFKLFFVAVFGQTSCIFISIVFFFSKIKLKITHVDFQFCNCSELFRDKLPGLLNRKWKIRRRAAWHQWRHLYMWLHLNLSLLPNGLLTLIGSIPTTNTKSEVFPFGINLFDFWGQGVSD